MNKSSLEAAAEAAAKVNAMLIAKGKLKPPSSSKSKTSGGLLRGIGEDLITAEVDINDAPQSARNMLTRGHSQDEICKYSGASISTRGRYMTLEERQNISTADCRPLYLHVQASTHDCVSLAISRIQDIIKQHVIVTGGVKSATVGVVTYPAKNTNGIVKTPGPITASLPSGPHFVQDKVFIGLEHSPSTYPVREKILGPGGTFLQHIRTETGANVTLRGRGSGFIEPTSGREAFEPLYIHITHAKVEGLQAAKSLAINLVDTAHVEFFQWQKQQRPVVQPVAPIVIPQVTSLPFQSQGVPSQTVIAYPTTYVTNHSQALARTVSTANNIVGVVPISVSAAYASSDTQTATITPLAQIHAPVQSVPLAYTSVPTSQAHLAQPIGLSDSGIVVRPDGSCFSSISQEYTSATAPIYSSSQVQNVASVLPISVIQRVEPVYPHIQYTTARSVNPTEVTYHPSQEVAKRDCFPSLGPSLQKSTNSNHPTENGALQSYSSVQMSGFSCSPKDRDLMPPPLNPSSRKTSPIKRGFSNEKEGDFGDQEIKKLRGALVGIASIYGSDDSSDEESSLSGESYSKSPAF